ncbi:MAG: RodZ domain-containing protein [Pseudomonadota bacterium]
MKQMKDEKTAELVAPRVTGVGTYLKSERENRSLSYDQVAQITKLRPYVLKALENEDWEKLPQPVFLKGFIRSYARALGLNERKIFKFFDELPPAEQGPLKLYQGEKKPRKGLLFILFILFGFIIIMMYLLVNDFLQEKPLSQKTDIRLSKSIPVNKERESRPVQAVEADIIKPVTSVPLDQTTKSEDDQSQQETVPTTANPMLFFPSEPIMASESHKLECFVKERTWVRIRIDKQRPKEFMLEPGQRSTWEAKKGFEILVGNAAGIEFELDGTKISNLGESGQVVRLMLPPNYQLENSED